MLCPAIPTTEEALTSRLLQSTIQTLESLQHLSRQGARSLCRPVVGRPGDAAGTRACGRHRPALRPRVARAAGRRRPAACRVDRRARRRAQILVARRARECAGDRRSSRPPRAAGSDGRWYRGRSRSGGRGLPQRWRRAVCPVRHRVPAGTGRHQPAGIPGGSRRALDSRGGRPARTSRHAPSRVADVGCGAGWSTIAMARAYPEE